jgi:hypothetical protein
MKKNKFTLISLAILIILAAFLILNQRSGTLKNRIKDFAIMDTASVTRIFLADKKNRTILLEKNDEDGWMLNKTYQARQSGINMLLETFVNLVAKYPVSKGGRDNVISQLAVQSVKVEIYQLVYRINLFGRFRLFQHEKLTKTMYIGGATPDNMGTFMLLEGSDTPFVVHMLGFRGFVAPRFSTLEKDWRDHTVFKTKLNEIRTVVMETPLDPPNSFKVSAENDRFILTDLYNGSLVQAYDTLRLLNFLTTFADIRYEALIEYIDPAKKDSIIQSVPRNIITVSDIYGNSKKIKIFYKANEDRFVDMQGNLYSYDIDRLYALVNEERDFVLIQYYVFDKMLRPLSFFRYAGAN